MSKFDTILEGAYDRLKQTSAIAGDYVKFGSNLKGSEWYKALDEARKATVDNIIAMAEGGKKLMVNYIKNDRAMETDGNTSARQIATISLEEAPGLWSNPLDLPYELLEFHGTGFDVRATEIDPNLEVDSKVTLKPEEVSADAEHEGPEIKHPNGDYENPEKDTKIPAQTAPYINYLP